MHVMHSAAFTTRPTIVAVTGARCSPQEPTASHNIALHRTGKRACAQTSQTEVCRVLLSLQRDSTPVDLHPTVLGRLRLALRNAPISLRPPHPCALARPGVVLAEQQAKWRTSRQSIRPVVYGMPRSRAPSAASAPLRPSAAFPIRPQCPKSPDRPLRPLAWLANRLLLRGPWRCPCAVTPILLSQRRSHPRHSPPSVHPFRSCCLSRQLALHFARPIPSATPLTENLLGLLPPPSCPSRHHHHLHPRDPLGDSPRLPSSRRP